MDELTIYIKSAHIDMDDKKVYLKGVDLGEVTGQHSIEAILDNYDVSNIQDYLTERIKSDEE